LAKGFLGVSVQGSKGQTHASEFISRLRRVTDLQRRRPQLEPGRRSPCRAEEPSRIPLHVLLGLALLLSRLRPRWSLLFPKVPKLPQAELALRLPRDRKERGPPPAVLSPRPRQGSRRRKEVGPAVPPPRESGTPSDFRSPPWQGLSKSLQPAAFLKPSLLPPRPCQERALLLFLKPSLLPPRPCQGRALQQGSFPQRSRQHSGLPFPLKMSLRKRVCDFPGSWRKRFPCEELLPEARRLEGDPTEHGDPRGLLPRHLRPHNLPPASQASVAGLEKKQDLLEVAWC
jgi:hypothetical protein